MRSKFLLFILLAYIGHINAQISFGPKTDYAVGYNPQSLCYADFNGDNIIDLAVANAKSDDVSILLGNGMGGFVAASTFQCGYAPYSVCSVDLNNDGKVDLATADMGPWNVHTIFGDGTGSFGADTNYSGQIDKPVEIVNADAHNFSMFNFNYVLMYYIFYNFI